MQQLAAGWLTLRLSQHHKSLYRQWGNPTWEGMRLWGSTSSRMMLEKSQVPLYLSGVSLWESLVTKTLSVEAAKLVQAAQGPTWKGKRLRGSISSRMTLGKSQVTLYLSSASLW